MQYTFYLSYTYFCAVLQTQKFIYAKINFYQLFIQTPSYALSGSIQRGISHTVAGLSSKPERDVLMQDFQVVETIPFPRLVLLMLSCII